jgi:hypothetical protein
MWEELLAKGGRSGSVGDYFDTPTPIGTDSFWVRVRRMVPADAPYVADWMCRERPVNPILAQALPSLLEHLITDDVISGCCLEIDAADSHSTTESRDDDDRWPVAGIGLSGFIPPAAAQELLDNPDPLFALHFLERIRQEADDPTFLRYEEIARANALNELILFPFLWLQTYSPNTPEGRHLFSQGQRAFLHFHVGYRLKRFLKFLPEELGSALEMGGMRAVRRVTVPGPDGDEMGFVLFDLTREEVEQRLPGSAIGLLFETPQPRCRFSRAQQQAMAWAIEGLSSEEIGIRIGKTKNAVDELFKDACRRLEDVYPTAFGFLTSTRKKRQRLLKYLRDNPQELRPYDWKIATQKMVK